MTLAKTAYLKYTLSFILCLLSYVYSAQTKSNEVKTINGKKYYIHKVEKGQSLYAIARLYEVDVNYILAENDEAIDGLVPGQQLNIPFDKIVAKTNPIDTNKYVYHKIAKGETIYAIGRKYSVDEKHLYFLNPDLNKGLKEGEYLVVGEKKKSFIKDYSINSNQQTYQVQKSETLYGISKKINVSIERLVELNPDAKNGIKEGQLLIIGTNSNAKLTTNTPVKSEEDKKSTFNSRDIENIDTSKINRAKKTTYKIGLLLPLKLNEIEYINIDELVRNKQNFPAIHSLVVDFYSGFKKAMDSLIDKDFEVELELFDIQEKDSLKVEQLCKSNEFKKLDLIVGPLYPSEFKLTASYAKKLKIPIVSPLTQQSKILYNNPFVSKTTPSVFTLLEEFASYVVDSLQPNSKVMVINSTLKDAQYVKTFKKEYNNELLSKGLNIKDSIIEVKGMSGVKANYVPGKKNVIALFTNNQVYIQDFVTQLYMFADKKDIELLGFSSMANIDNLDQEYLNQLNFQFATASNINYNDSSLIPIIKDYQLIYNTDPSENYFNSYDLGMYYLSLLKTIGPDFMFQLEKYKSEGLSTGFNFERPDSETGFENRFTRIYKYSNYKLQKIGWK
jgi:LysM repeat protein